MTRDELVECIRSSPVSHLEEQIVSRIKPSIRLTTQPVAMDALPLGATRMGGVPDLPPDVEWPHRGDTPLAFIAQVRLSDVSTLDRDSLLPPTGWLCFFYDAEEQPWGFEPADRDGWRILYFDTLVDHLHRATAPALPEDSAFRACSVTAEVEDTLADSSALITEGVLEHMSEDFHAYFHLVEEQSDEEEEGRHRLLGNPDVIQAEMRFICHFVSKGISYLGIFEDDDPTAGALANGADDWILLLQVDTDEDGPGWMWGDCGHIYYWIRKQDLAQRDFDHAYVVLECA
jgi:uncharacterized protein YwqG